MKVAICSQINKLLKYFPQFKKNKSTEKPLLVYSERKIDLRTYLKTALNLYILNEEKFSQQENISCLKKIILF